MRKIRLFMSLLLIVLLVVTSSCTSKKTYKMLVPNGTPLLGVATFIAENKDDLTYEVVLGANALVAGFVNNDYDIIVAPVNLGAKMYNQNPKYMLYKSFVWGNFYLASLNKINEINDINGKKVVLFGAASSPDIMFKVISNYYKLDVEVEYVDDVSTANAMLLSGKAEFIVSAEPSISVLRNKKNIYTLSMQSLWVEATSGNMFPQAGIFINKQSASDKAFIKLLDKVTTSLNGYKEPATLANNSVTIDDTFSKMGVDPLVKAIPNCNFGIYDKQTEREYVKCYFEKLIELGFALQIGNKLPNEEFYG